LSIENLNEAPVPGDVQGLIQKIAGILSEHLEVVGWAYDMFSIVDADKGAAVTLLVQDWTSSEVEDDDEGQGAG
jgi:hypothetical protein